MTITATAPTASKLVSEAAAELFALRAQIEDLQAAEDELETSLIAAIGLGNSVEVEGVALLTVYNSTTSTVDFDAVTALHPTWVRRITQKVIDTKKFGLLLKAGEVPEDVVAIVKTKTTKDTLKVTKR